jgi:hypothetical protein
MNVFQNIEEKFSQMNENFSNEIKDFENKYVSFDKIGDCERNKSKYLSSEKYSSIEDDNLILKGTNNVLEKIKEVNEFKCRKHYLDRNKPSNEQRHFYGGMDDDNLNKCYGELNNCILFSNKQECETKAKEIKNAAAKNNQQEMLRNEKQGIKSHLLAKNKLMEYEPLDNAHPGYIGDEYQETFPKVNFINCRKHLKDTSTCKHINENRIADIITVKEVDSIEKPENVINKLRILELHPTFLEPKPDGTEVSQDEIDKEKQIKYTIEPYMEEFKDIDPGLIFNHFTYKIKIKDNKVINGLNVSFNSVIEILENNESIGNMKDNQGDDFILKKGHKIHTFIDNDNRFNVNVLDQENIIQSNFRSPKKLNGEFGEDLNLYIRTNNVSMFENVKKVEKLNELIYPYNPFIDVEAV